MEIDEDFACETTFLHFSFFFCSSVTQRCYPRGHKTSISILLVHPSRPSPSPPWLARCSSPINERHANAFVWTSQAKWHRITSTVEHHIVFRYRNGRKQQTVLSSRWHSCTTLFTSVHSAEVAQLTAQRHFLVTNRLRRHSLDGATHRNLLHQTIRRSLLGRAMHHDLFHLLRGLPRSFHWT